MCFNNMYAARKLIFSLNNSTIIVINILCIVLFNCLIFFLDAFCCFIGDILPVLQYKHQKIGNALGRHCYSHSHLKAKNAIVTHKS